MCTVARDAWFAMRETPGPYEQMRAALSAQAVDRAPAGASFADSAVDLSDPWWWVLDLLS